MVRGDVEHQALIFEAGKHRLGCNTCDRYHMNPNLNPANLLRHLRSAHNYGVKVKAWWQFWK